MAGRSNGPSVGRALFLSQTMPVELMLWGMALCWLAFLAILPDVTYAHLRAEPLLSVKALWVYPAALKVALPALVYLNGGRWSWLLYLSRLYALAWWLFLTTATAILTPTQIPYWGTATVAALASVWLLVRFATRGARGRED